MLINTYTRCSISFDKQSICAHRICDLQFQQSKPYMSWWCHCRNGIIAGSKSHFTSNNKDNKLALKFIWHLQNTLCCQEHYIKLLKPFKPRYRKGFHHQAPDWWFSTIKGLGKWEGNVHSSWVLSVPVKLLIHLLENSYLIPQGQSYEHMKIICQWSFETCVNIYINTNPMSHL